MQFTRLWPLAFLILIPLLILLYMLKKQNKPKVVSSIFLWQEIYETTYADKPWQKLKNHILLVLEVLGIGLIILALMNPQVPWGRGHYKNVIFVVDESASMQVLYEVQKGPRQNQLTRLDAAKQWMKSYINESSNETKGYLVEVGRTSKLTLAGSSERNKLLLAIEAIQPTLSSTDLIQGVEMAKSLGESLQEAYEIIVLTDKKVESKLEAGRYIYFGNTGVNGAIALMAHQNTEKGMRLMVQTVNKGVDTYSSDVALYGYDENQGKEVLVDIKEVNLKAGESGSVHFDLAPEDNYSYLKGELVTKDALEKDNVYYYVPREVQGRRILLITEGNVFLEKALMTQETCEVFKTTDLSLMESDETYDLYVLDRQVVEKLPDFGNVLMLGCDLGDSILEELKITNQNKHLDAKRIKAVAENLPNYLKNTSFVTGEATSYTLPYWGKSILKSSDEVIGFMGEKDGRKIGVVGIDLWSGDLVLKTEFPLLMHYLEGELLDTSRVNKSNFITDEEIQIKQKNLEEEIDVYNFRGEKVDINPIGILEDNEIGIYKVDINRQEESFSLAINYPTAKESDLIEEVLGEETVGEAGSLKSRKNLTAYLIVLILSVILAEWYFYRKGY